MEEETFITGSFGYLYSAGNTPSHICRGNASEEVQIVYIGRLQAAGVFFTMGLVSWHGLIFPKQDTRTLQRDSTSQSNTF